MAEVGADLAEGVVDVPGYTVAERIGAGGFGEVLRARHDLIGRDVAIKVLHARYSTDPDAVARFVAEARAVGKLSHPGIVDLYDFGQLADGRQYCVMELIRGRTLRDLLGERTRLPLAEALPILRGIAEAIDAAHAAGIAHRDLKPDNVFVLDGGGVKLIDFGLAKLAHDDPTTPVTATGAVFGTPLYMSPEQCRGKAVDLRTDAYSFGALAYHVLTGEPPFSGDALGLALHHLNDTPVLPSKRYAELPERVDRTILALLDKDPAARPSPLAAAVAELVGERGGRRRRRRWVAPAAVIAGLALAVGGWQLIHRRAAPHHLGPQTVAVLGFKNLGDADHAWIGTGLAVMLGRTLEAGDTVRVPSVQTVAEEKAELGIPDTDSPSHEELERLRAAFSPDYLVVGSFRPHDGVIEIDARLLDAAGELVAEAHEDVPEVELPQAAVRLGGHLRDALGVGALDPGAAGAARKLWPGRVEAMRHYALGIAALFHEDHRGALPELAKVTELEPDFALGHLTLGFIFENLGDARQVEEFDRAFRLADGLPERERLDIEAESKRWSDPEAALRAVRRLFELDPQDLQAGFVLVDREQERNHPDEALRVLAKLRALPAPASNDPNLDFREGAIAAAQGQLDRCVVLATRSEASSLRARRPNMFLQARNLELECLFKLGKLDEFFSLVDDTVARARASGGKPDVEWGTLELKCQALQQRGDLVGAEAACREAVAAVRPTSAAGFSRDAWLNLALILVAEEKFEDAKVALATAEHACTNARPPCPSDRRAEAKLHGSLGELEPQRAILVAMLDAARKAHDDRTTVLALRDLAQADYEQLQPGDDCIARTREAIAIADAHPDLFSYDERADGYRGLGNMLGDRGRFDDAMAARQKALDILKAAGDHQRWLFSRNFPARILVMANRPVEAEQWARDALSGDSSRDDARATLVDALVAQGKVAGAEKVVGELVGQSGDAMFARAWVALHHGKSATTERRTLETQLAELEKRGLPIDIARLELRIARLAVAANDPGARKRLSGLAEELRKQGLGGLAALADREAASH